MLHHCFHTGKLNMFLKKGKWRAKKIISLDTTWLDQRKIHLRISIHTPTKYFNLFKCNPIHYTCARIIYSSTKRMMDNVHFFKPSSIFKTGRILKQSEDKLILKWIIPPFSSHQNVSIIYETGMYTGIMTQQWKALIFSYKVLTWISCAQELANRVNVNWLCYAMKFVGPKENFIPLLFKYQ